jgi:hypothetical protein
MKSSETFQQNSLKTFEICAAMTFDEIEFDVLERESNTVRAGEDIA